MTKVAIIGSKGVPACYGGFETLAENMVRHLAKKFSFIVYCSGPGYEEHRDEYLGAELKYIPLGANGIQSIPYDVISMLSARRHADILLILGVSGCMFLPLIKLFSRKKFIVHLDGVDWRRPKWGFLARHFLRLSEWVAARSADHLIADNKVIQQYIKANYGRDSFLVAYGGDHALSELPQVDESGLSVIALQKTSDWQVPTDPVITFDKYAVLVCRIEPENNIHVILEAFSESADMPLVAIGNWAHSAYSRELRDRYNDNPNILILDPIYDTVRLFGIRSNASLYVHGHSAGGTNPALVEAMCLGLPVLAFDVAFNRATTLEQAAYFADVVELRQLLAEARSEVLRFNGEQMRTIAVEMYTWSAIAKRYVELFAAAGAGNQPEPIEAPRPITQPPAPNPILGAGDSRPIQRAESID